MVVEEEEKEDREALNKSVNLKSFQASISQ